MMRHDQLILVKERIGNGNSFIQQAAWISAQIEYQTVEHARINLLERSGKFCLSRLIEPGKLYITNIWLDPESDVD